jgi:hypothetical protein
MSRFLIALVAGVVVLGWSSTASAQMPTFPAARMLPRPPVRPAIERVVVELVDGSEVTGHLIASGPSEIVVRTGLFRTIVIERTRIVRIGPASQASRPQANATQATGRPVSLSRPGGGPLKRGQTRVGLFPLVQTGVTDHVSVGVAPLILPNGRFVIFAVGQAAIHAADGSRLSAGVLHSEWIDGGRLGLWHVTGTKRWERSSLTAGVFSPYVQSDGLTGKLTFYRAGASRVIGRGLTLSADGLGSRRGAVVMTTIGGAADGAAWRLGVAMAVKDGRVTRALPVVQFSLRK